MLVFIFFPPEEFLYVEDNLIFEVGSWMKVCPFNAKNVWNSVEYKRSARVYVSNFIIGCKSSSKINFFFYWHRMKTKTKSLSVEVKKEIGNMKFGTI